MNSLLCGWDGVAMVMGTEGCNGIQEVLVGWGAPDVVVKQKSGRGCVEMLTFV